MATFDGYTHKKSSLRTKAAFLSAFLSLMRQKNFDEISVSDLIKGAGYSRTTFYSYYQDKFDMVEKIVDEEAVDFVNAICGPIPNDAVMKFDSKMFLPGLSLFRHVAQRKDLYYFLIHNMLPGYSMDFFCRKTSKVFHSIISIEITDHSMSELNFDLYCYITTDTYLSFIKYWELHDFSFSPEYMAEQMMTNWINVKKVSSVSVKTMPPAFNILEALG